MRQACQQWRQLWGVAAAAMLAGSAAAAPILFVGGSGSPSGGADGDAYAFLQARYGYGNVDYIQASTAATGSAAGYQLLVLSSTPASGDIRSKWDTLATAGIVNWEEAVADDGSAGEFDMADSISKVTTNPVVFNITNTAHPIAAGFAAGNTTVTFDNAETYYGNTPGPGVQSIGSQPGNPARHAILVADVGDTLRGGGSSPNRRVMFPITDNTFGHLNANGLTLFGQSTDWAGGLTPLPQVAYYAFPVGHGAGVETGSSFSPTLASSHLDSGQDMAFQDSSGNVTLEVSNPGPGYASQPVLRVDPDGNASSLAQALTNDVFFEFSLAPGVGFEMDLDGLEFDAARGGGATPRGWGLTSSLDDFNAVLGTGDIPTARPDFTHFVVSLADPAFQQLVDPVTFRMYVYSPANGATLEFDNVVLYGSISATEFVVPEPAAALLLAAAGVWLMVGRRRA